MTSRRRHTWPLHIQTPSAATHRQDDTGTAAGKQSSTTHSCGRRRASYHSSQRRGRQGAKRHSSNPRNTATALPGGNTAIVPRTTPALQRRRTQQHARSSTCIPEQVRRNTQGCRNKTADRRTAREGVDENGDGREGVRACDVARGRVGACEPRTRWPRFIWPSRTARQARSGGLSGHTACASARTPGGRQGGRVAEIQAPPPPTLRGAAPSAP